MTNRLVRYLAAAITSAALLITGPGPVAPEARTAAQSDQLPVSGTAVYWVKGKIIYLTIGLPWEIWELADGAHPVQVIVRTPPNTPRAVITPPDSTPFWLQTEMFDDSRLKVDEVRFTVDAPDFALIGGYPVTYDEHCYSQHVAGQGWSDGTFEWTATLP